MGKTITRAALYDAVWSLPIVKLAKDFGVSDVGLAKACRKLAVPLPPRGWWARKAAGQPVIKVALPPRPPGLSLGTTIGGGGREGWGWSGPPEEAFLGEVPPPVTFDEPLEEVRLRIEDLVGKTAVIHRNLEEPHLAVAKLLAQDAARRATGAERPYILALYPPLYESPLQQRRLRLASSILATAARCGCRAEPRTPENKDAPVEAFSVVVGDRHVRLLVTAVEPKRPRAGAKTASRPAAPTLRVEVGDRVWDNVDPGNSGLIREVAKAIVLQGEEDLRAQAAFDRSWWLDRRAAIIERRQKEAEEAARRERERLAELERQRVERLLGEAEALRKAQAIRTYVREVRSSAPPVSPEELESWATWALEQADRIDPVFNGAFMEAIGRSGVS